MPQSTIVLPAFPVTHPSPFASIHHPHAPAPCPCRAPPCHSLGAAPFQRKYAPRPATPEGVVLDGFLLLAAGDDELPEAVAAARVSGRCVAGVEVADMAYFQGLRVLDASDNRVRRGWLGRGCCGLYRPSDVTAAGIASVWLHAVVMQASCVEKWS